jgi:hypothetical protein
MASPQEKLEEHVEFVKNFITEWSADLTFAMEATYLTNTRAELLQMLRNVLYLSRPRESADLLVYAWYLEEKAKLIRLYHAVHLSVQTGWGGEELLSASSLAVNLLGIIREFDAITVNGLVFLKRERRTVEEDSHVELHSELLEEEIEDASILQYLESLPGAALSEAQMQWFGELLEQMELRNEDQ